MNIKIRYRLYKIEKATNIHLMKKQRKLVLNPNRPSFDFSWGRASGKTTTAVFWALLWLKDSFSFRNELDKFHPLNNQPLIIPDPDSTTAPRYRNTCYTYMQYSVLCTQHAIPVATINMNG